MKRSATLAAAVAAFLAGAVAVQADPPRPMSTKDFVQAAAGSDHFEVLEARVAMVEGRNPRVRSFAQQMIQAHTATLDALAQATASAGLPPPPAGLSGDQAMLLSALQAQRAPDFDKTYVRHQVLGHTQALAVEQGYANTRSDPAVRRAANAAVPIIQHHLDEARQLCSYLGCDS